MHNQMPPSGRGQSFGMQNQNGDISMELGTQAESNDQRNQTVTTSFTTNSAQTPTVGTGSYVQQTNPVASSYASPGMPAPNAGYSGTTQMPIGVGAGRASSQQLSYDQFQEQARQRQEQEQIMARQALLNAGADRQSDKTRAVLQQLSSLSQEIQRAENQIQVQMDAQLRQLQLIHQRVRQAESLIQETLPNLQTPGAGLRQ